MTSFVFEMTNNRIIQR